MAGRTVADILRVDGVQPISSTTNDEQTLVKKSTTIRDLCSELLQFLRSKPTPAEIDQRLEQLVPRLERHSTLQKKITKWHFAQEFDAVGTEIFNVSTRIGRTSPHFDKAIICHLRFASILILECGRKSTRDPPAAHRLLKTCIKTARMCLENEIYHLAHKVLEKAGDHQDELSRTEANANEARFSSTELQVDYFMAEQQENYQLAEYMLSKLVNHSLLSELVPPKYLSVAELLFNSGTKYLKKRLTNKAISWLTQCRNIVFQREDDSLVDIRIKTLQNLTRAHLWRNQDDDLEQAASIIECASEDFSVAAWIYLLRLDLAAKQYPGDSKPVATLLESMIRVVHMTNSVFLSIIRKIHELFKGDRHATIRILDLLLPKTAELDETDWIEKALITRIWVTTQISETDHDVIITGLSESFDCLEKRMTKNLGPKATHAAQIILWKASEGFFARQNYKLTIRWCSLARHSLFQVSGLPNACKLIRRIAFCHIELGDHLAARAVLAELPKDVASHALNHYLQFRIDIRYSSEADIIANVKRLLECKDFQLPMLYSCAIESQSLKNNNVSLSLLSTILAQTKKTGVDNALRMPALLRCIIKLLRADMEHNMVCDERQIQLLCTQLENAAQLVETPETTSQNGFNIRELEWFSKTAHNIAITGLSKWNSEQVMRIVRCSKAFLQAYSPGLSIELRREIQARKVIASYIALCTNTFAGREESNMARRSEYYQVVCSEAMHFRQDFVLFEGEQAITPIPSDLLAKLAVVLVFEFEARVNLSSWLELNNLIQLANRHHLPSLPLNCMADLVLNSAAPAEASFSLIEALTNVSLANGEGDLRTLSKWLRMLFTLALNRDQSFLDDFCYKLMQIIRDNASTYPVDEIQWLAARSFNHAVDIHTTGNVESCHRMCEIALNIGNYAQDEDLKLQIQENYQQIITTLQASPVVHL